jgi:hypothetical protein
MKIKKEYIILALFIVGLSVYLFMRKGDRNLYELPVLQEVAKNEISKIEISKGTTSIVLSKKDEKWHIAPRDYPADGNLIDGMLNEFENLTVTTLVSESGDYQRYDLGDDKKITVKAWGGEKLLHARNNFRNTVDKSVDDLRDKSVLSFQTADITEIQVAKGTTSLALSRKEVTEEDTQTQTDSSAAAAPPPPKMVWQSADDKKGDEQNINRLLSTISNLRCEKFIDDRKKEDFTESVFSIDLKGIQSHRLSIFAKLKEDDESYPAVSSGSDYPFLLSKHTADRIMKNPEDLLEKPKADEEKSEVEKPEPKQKKQ